VATYTELFGLFGNSALANRVEVACIIAAEAIRSEDVGTVNHANRVLWAKRAFQNPGGVRDQMMMALLASYAGQTVAVITGATDAVLQEAVAVAVDLFADGT